MNSDQTEASNIQPRIHESWLTLLREDFEAPYFQSLKRFILEEKKQYQVYPPSKLIFAAFDRCPVEQCKVVILGQDPYHGPGQAHGLSFSVPSGIPQPPSLQNIFKELQEDLGLKRPESGNLEPWADQGVLLLNATLTVRKSLAGAHQNQGWERFTDAAIQKLADTRENLVFMLWGRFARSKKPLIDATRHLILEAAHPSPFSARNGFFGCRHFSKANAYLQSHGMEPIDWSLD